MSIPLPQGDMVLVVVHYYSRDYELEIMKTTTAEKTIRVMRNAIVCRRPRSVTKSSDVREGEAVLLNRERQGKLDTPFHPQLCQVVAKSGCRVTAESAQCARYDRDRSHVKRYNSLPENNA